MLPEHSHHVAHFMVEILMGAKLYSDEYGDDALRHMVGKHTGLKICRKCPL